VGDNFETLSLEGNFRRYLYKAADWKKEFIDLKTSMITDKNHLGGLLFY